MTQEQNKRYYDVLLPSGKRYTYHSFTHYIAGDVVLVKTANNELPLKGIVQQETLLSFPRSNEILGKYPEFGCPYLNASMCIITHKLCTHPNPICIYYGNKGGNNK